VLKRRHDCGTLDSLETTPPPREVGSILRTFLATGPHVQTLHTIIATPNNINLSSSLL
jgi:hypothetical protein